MEKISAIIITKNEEKNIKRCLDSLTFADEIIVVDSGSEDKTSEICKKYKNLKFYETDWMGFGPTKKYGVSLCSNDWVFSIDADEEVSLELKDKIVEILCDTDDNECFYIRRRTFYLEKMIKYCGWQRDYVLRLFNRKIGNFNDKMVHELVEHPGEKIRIKSPLYHYSYPTIKSHLEKINLYTDIAAKEKVKKGKKASLFSGVFHGIYRFFNMYIFNLGFLCGKEGFVLCLISSFGVSLKYFKIWSLNRLKK